MADRVFRRCLFRFSFVHGHFFILGSWVVAQDSEGSAILLCGIRMESSDSVADSGQVFSAFRKPMREGGGAVSPTPSWVSVVGFMGFGSYSVPTGIAGRAPATRPAFWNPHEGGRFCRGFRAGVASPSARPPRPNHGAPWASWTDNGLESAFLLQQVCHGAAEDQGIIG